ncbi:MAG: hypothetical protein ACK41T_06495 [Pseudobdellovibrio sp.]
MKKSVLTLSVLILTSQAFAGGPVSICQSKKGNILSYNESQGKLIVKNNLGQVLSYYENIKSGSTQYIEAKPGYFLTDLIIANTQPVQKIGEFQTLTVDGTQQILFQNEVYKCNW